MQCDLDAFVAFCFQHDWLFDVADDATLTTRRHISQGDVLCMARVEPQYFIFRSRYPFSVPESKRMLVAEFAARVNHHSAFGTMDLDFADGAIEITTAIPLEEGHLCSALISPVVQLNLIAADQWFGGVVGVCFSDVAPRIAFEQCRTRYSIAQVVERAMERFESENDED